MSCFPYRMRAFPLVVVLMAILASSGNAQINESGGDASWGDEHGLSGGRVCGTTWMNAVSQKELLANTARLDPGLYRRIVQMHEDKERNRRVMKAAEGDEWIFLVSNRITHKFDSVRATLVWTGNAARIWIDNKDTAKKSVQNMVLPLGRSLDSVSGATSRNPKRGVLENDIDVFGQPPTTYAALWDYKTNFLFTDIKDSVAGGFVAGYFSPNDQTDELASNHMNLLYIDSKEGVANGLNAIVGTIAHEFQHLIHYARRPNSETLFNEGASEVASIINGYRDRQNTGFLGNTNVDLFRWSYTDGTKLLADYERAMTLVHYMYEQFGENFLTQFVASQATMLDRITDGAVKSGHQTDWKEVLKGFAVANYLGTYAADSRYGYRLRLSTAVPKVDKTVTGSDFPLNTTVSLAAYGSSYMVLSKPQGVVHINYSSARPAAMLAIGYRGSAITVDELQPGTDYDLGDPWHGVYDKIVLVFVGLDNSQLQVTLKAESTPLSVDEAAGSAGALSLSGSIPNPVSAGGVIGFTTAATGPVTVKLYDARGTLAATLIDGERLAEGDHTVRFDATGLAGGYYMLRLTQGAAVVNQPVIVAK